MQWLTYSAKKMAGSKNAGTMIIQMARKEYFSIKNSFPAIIILAKPK